jgi:hypothetical protein
MRRVILAVLILATTLTATAFAQTDRAWCTQRTADVIASLPRDHYPFLDWIAIRLAGLRGSYESAPNDVAALPTYRELAVCVEQLKRVFAARPPDTRGIAGTESADAMGLRIDIDSFASRTESAVYHLELEEQRETVRRRAVEAKRWPADIEQAVLGRRVRLGMTTEQVELSWGKPSRVNETRNAGGLSEQWVYPGRDYLYFSNGVLTSIQRSR